MHEPAALLRVSPLRHPAGPRPRSAARLPGRHRAGPAMPGPQPLDRVASRGFRAEMRCLVRCRCRHPRNSREIVRCSTPLGGTLYTSLTVGSGVSRDVTPSRYFRFLRCAALSCGAAVGTLASRRRYCWHAGLGRRISISRQWHASHDRIRDRAMDVLAGTAATRDRPAAGRVAPCHRV